MVKKLMALSPRNLFTRFSFRQQLTMSFALGIVILAIVSSAVIPTITEKRLHNQLVEQGNTVINNFAKQSTLPLLFRSEESAQEASQPILTFPNVVGVSILTPENNILYQEGEDTLPQGYSLPREQLSTWQIERADAWYFSLPVYAGESANEDDDILFGDSEPELEFVGTVQIVLSKEALYTITSDILRSTLLLIGAVSSLLLLILLMITNRVTKPIRDLSAIMTQAQEGQSHIRANLKGSKDIQHMENAFNKMMCELEDRESELKRARDTALASARIKGQFATTVSHELRTPMNGVMGMLELLHSMDLNDEQLDYVNIARSSGEELLLLIDDILDFSKIESGKLKLHKSTFNTREMVKSITELLSSQAQQKRLSISCDIDPSVPELVLGDTGRIRQVLINLIGNAIKFTHQGSITIRITTIESQSNSLPQLHYAIEDTGIGIEESAQQRIFEAFSQADGSTTRQFGGTGLGLAICSQLVELMGGSIGVQSEMGKGSIFWITLPLETGSAATLPDTQRHADIAGSRILIVSRTPESCHTLINNFIQWQCFQRNTTSANEALSLMQQSATQGKPFDFLIIDTPLGNGNEKDLINDVRNDSLVRQTGIVLLAHNVIEDLPVATECIKKSPSTDLLLDTLLKMRSQKSIVVDQEVETDTTSKILVVEDNRTNQLVAEGMIQKLEHACQLAENGSAAIDALERQKFDLVLMDCHMPVMNGYTATQLIRGKDSSYQNIPIIALTASVGPAEINRCFNAGMSDYIAKPLTLEKLQPKVEKWLLDDEELSSSEKAEIASNSLEDGAGHNPSRDTLDLSVLNLLRGQIEDSFIQLVDAYIADSPVYIENLATALRNQSADDIKYYSHLIKGSSSNLGATKLANYCQNIEDISATQEFDNAEKIIQSLNDEFTQVKALLVKQSKQKIEEPFRDLDVKPHILVVDDDQSSRIVMRGILEKNGYKITEVNSGIDALKFCQNEVPDLILMDALMPVMDGFTTCEKIMSLDCDTYPTILMITALQDEGTLERAFAAGATDFILKPINMTVLQQRVSRALHTGHIDRHIHHLSYYDNLTALPNRTFFIERSKNLLNTAEQHHTKVAVIFLDLDRFKLVNDSQGHESGDLLLKAFSKRLESCVRSADLVARLGGDEFTVVLNNIKTPEAASKVAEKIQHALREPFTFTNQQIYISSSIGISFYPDNGTSINELMKQADTAMFQAKAKGGGNYVFYEPGMESDVTRQIELEIEIREALEQDQFVLYYQPQVELNEGKLVGLEALIRWEHPVKGLVPPFEFIPWAEKCGLITSIGDWVIKHACHQLNEWLSQGIDPVPIAVNVSGGELADSVLYERVAAALAEYNIPPELLKLEITEDTLAGGDDITTQHLQELRSLGTTLAIDDFGTGYSSLSYLKMFPVDTLKIDRSFVKDLPEDSNSAAIVAGIIALGHSLKLMIVAEGVETEEQQEFLKGEGCDIIQGYLLSKPLPTDMLEEWIQEAQNRGGHLWFNSPDAPRGSHQTPPLP